MENFDTFNEQITKMKMKPWMYIVIVLCWIVVAAAVVLAVMMFASGSPIFVLLAAGTGYFAYRITTTMSIEYEYILTNGEIDIDKIVSKSTRTRLITFDCKEIKRIEKFNPAALNNEKNVKYVCNTDAENVYTLYINNKKHGDVIYVMQLGEKLRNGMKGFLPLYIVKDVFGE